MATNPAKKRTLEGFFKPAPKPFEPLQTPANDNTTSVDSDHLSANAPSPKRSRTSSSPDLAPASAAPPSTHPSYPHPIPSLPDDLHASLLSLTFGVPPTDPVPIASPALGLDLLTFTPFLPRHVAASLFAHLRTSLPFYRVEYDISRGGGAAVHIRTPRFTTVFGVDASARFVDSPSPAPTSSGTLVDAASGAPLPATRYAQPPRPLPSCLSILRDAVSAATGEDFNFCLVNYYATGDDSISPHSDDERFLGPEPAIASLSLGAARDFVMKPKAAGAGAGVQGGMGGGKGGRGGAGARRQADKASSAPAGETRKWLLRSGDMVLMRGQTQARWLHGVPKRKGGGEGSGRGGRINVTFRRAMVRGGTENYYKYNVGEGPMFRWAERRREMVEMR